MNSDNEKPAPVVWGILSPVLDWATQPEKPEPEPSNVIYLADYKPKLH